MNASPTSSNHRVARRAADACLLGLVACVGCYNGDTLVDRARNKALRTRIETIDLGMYDVTMPRTNGPHGMTEVQIEPFGRTVRYKLGDIEQQIEDRDYRLRHAVTMTVRSSEPEDFADPDLKRLRERLLDSVQEALGDDAIRSIGFHQVRFVRH